MGERPRRGRFFFVRDSGWRKNPLDGACGRTYYDNELHIHYGASHFSLETLLLKIETEIASIGGKRSKSRADVIKVFFRAGSHMTVEELTCAVRKRNTTIGFATVYRTVKLLTRLGYAKELDFGDGQKRYENNLVGHHDHLVCRGCGMVSEFEEPRIETLQEQVAKRHGFRPTAHRLDIYGYCRECAPAGKRND